MPWRTLSRAKCCGVRHSLPLRLTSLPPSLLSTLTIVVVLNQELGEPYRPDAMKAPNVVAGVREVDMKRRSFGSSLGFQLFLASWCSSEVLSAQSKNRMAAHGGDHPIPQPEAQQSTQSRACDDGQAMYSRRGVWTVEFNTVITESFLM